MIDQPLNIVTYPYPTLRYQSKPIKKVDAYLKRVVDEMFDLMYEANGVGLAANQVDIPLRMFVVNPTGQRDDGEEMVLINPTIDRPKGSWQAEEGCLSLPGMYGNVVRPKQIHFRAFDIRGNVIERTVDDFLGRVLQHENDHLNGVMFVDRMSEQASNELAEPLNEFQTAFDSMQSQGAIPSNDQLLANLVPWEHRYA